MGRGVRITLQTELAVLVVALVVIFVLDSVHCMFAQIH